MKKIISVFIVILFLGSVQAGWGPELCEDVTCSGHGYCEEDGSDEWCVCDSGYIADGLNCVLGCDGETCSGHGTCSVAGGVEVCTCEPGFHSVGLQCILDEASTVDTLAIINEVDCYNTGNCHYRFIFATNYYNFTPENASLYDIIINVKDPENNWHNYWKTVAQCLSESVCDNLDAQYVDFWWQHEIGGNQYIAVEITGNGDDAYDHLYHDVIVDPCYGVQCGPTGTCDNSSGYPVCSCGYGYVARNNFCEEGWFEDENLAAAVVDILQRKGFEVEDELDIDPAYMFDDINYLYLRGLNIFSLVGINLFPDLAALDVSDNNIDDLWPLGQKESLVELNISENPVSDGEIFSTLNLFNLDISNTKIYDFTHIKEIATLDKLTISNENYDPVTYIRPDGFSMEAWFTQEAMDGCFRLSVPEMIGGKYSKPVSNNNCSGGGTCIMGKCVCDTGYHEHNGDCVKNSTPCPANTHWNSILNGCFPNYVDIKCGFVKLQKLHGTARYEWNGSEYVLPAWKNTTPFHISETGLNQDSICLYECAPGFTYIGDGKCEAGVAYRDIPESSYNKLLVPGISRQDVSLEPIPGIPSFAPGLSLKMYYDLPKKDNNIYKYSLKGGWYIDLPRVELTGKNLFAPTKGISLYQLGWDEKTLTVYMPWGSEEYSVVVEKKCYNKDNDQEEISCSSGTTYNDWYVYKIFPSPGQNVFSYIEMKARKGAFSQNGTTINSYDEWYITRHGDDGSVTKFVRTVPKPAEFILMDYIPISEYKTRDGKIFSFAYLWDTIEINNSYSHMIIDQAKIIDPAKRVIRIVSGDENSETGIFGKPSSDMIREPLNTEINIYAGVLESGQIVSERRVARYTEIQNFDMQAYIYRNGNEYRMDQYTWNIQNSTLSLVTGDSEMKWMFTARAEEKTNFIHNFPSGYIESRKINNAVGGMQEKWTKKQVLFPHYFDNWLDTGISPSGIPWSYRFFNSGLENGFVLTTVYSEETGGVENTENGRIVQTEFNDWFQIIGTKSCKYNEGLSCDGSGVISSSEKFGYNVNGSPVYFESIDGQVSMDIYNEYDITGSNYNIFYSYNGISALNDLHHSGKIKCSAVYEKGSSRNFIDQYESYAFFGSSSFNINNWCSNASDQKAAVYQWSRPLSGKPYDLQTIIYPDGRTKTFTYDYEISSSLPSGYTANGKVWGEILTGRNSQNSVETCYAYNNDYQLVAQGIGTAESCDYKKGFIFDYSDTGSTMIEDGAMWFNPNAGDGGMWEMQMSNKYIHDDLGRKIAEKNSAGVSTIYVYDSLDRVVFTFFGCNIDDTVFPTYSSTDAHFKPYDFSDSDSAGESGTGVSFSNDSEQFNYSGLATLTNCEYYRKYKYDSMSNLTYTYFFEYWDFSNHLIVKNTSAPKIIEQKTQYDLIGRPYKSCQKDGVLSQERCIETEHDIFGNITKKSENGVERVVTYDYLNNPEQVKVNNLIVQENEYDSGKITAVSNKYNNPGVTTVKALFTYPKSFDSEFFLNPV